MRRPGGCGACTAAAGRARRAADPNNTVTATLQACRRRSSCAEVTRRYGERTALAGVSLTLEAGADARRARAQRRRQDDAAADARDAAAPARRRAARARPRAPRRGLGGARADRPARPRPAALPRADRPREPAPSTPRCTASPPRGSPSCSRRSAWSAAPTSRCARSRAAWCSASRSAARCCTTPSCCCSTSRAPTSTRPPASWIEPLIGRASGRTRVIVSHDPAGALAEADLVLGLVRGRAALLRAGRRARRRGGAGALPVSPPRLAHARSSPRCCARSCASSCARSSRCRR